MLFRSLENLYIQSSDSSSSSFNKALLDSLSLADAKILDSIKGLQENFTPLETLIRAASKKLEDINIADSEAKLNLLKVFVDSILQGDVLSFDLSKSLLDSTVTTDVFIATIAKIVLLSDINNLVSTPALNLDKVTSDNISFTDAINRLLILNRNFSENDYQDYTVDNTYFLEDYVRSGAAVHHSDSLITKDRKSTRLNSSH